MDVRWPPGAVVVDNGRIQARFSRKDGSARFVRAGHRDAVIERLGVDVQRVGISVEVLRSYYARIRVECLADGVRVERTYELTAGPSAYVQLAVWRAPGAVNWAFEATPDSGLWVERGPRDLQLPRPTDLAPHLSVRALAPGPTVGDGLKEGDVHLSQAVVRPKGTRSPPGLVFHRGFGIESPGLFVPEARRDEPHVTFVNWNVHERLAELIPVVDDDDRRDLLIRAAIHLLERMEADGGWPRWFAWSFYPPSNRYTSHVRGFMPLLYLWAHLTLERRGDRLVHVPGDADEIFRRLDATWSFFDPEAPTNFSDRMDDGTPYIAYSALQKESLQGRPRGVINTHSRAMHFAWLMAEASALMGAAASEARWRSALKTYHQGTKALFARLYPGRQDGQIHRGLIGYSLERPRITTRPGRIGYSDATFEAIVASYLANNDHHPAFAEIVERATLLDPNPFTEGPDPGADSSHALRLIRAYPPALAFFGDAAGRSEGISGDVFSVSLAELLTHEEQRRRGALTKGRHHPDRVIASRGPSGETTWIATNNAFTADWTPGFFEEVEHPGAGAGFRVVTSTSSGRWAIARRGAWFDAMASHDGTQLTIEVPVARYRIERRRFTGHGWGPPEVEAETRAGRVTLRLDAKDAVRIHRLDRSRQIP